MKRIIVAVCAILFSFQTVSEADFVTSCAIGCGAYCIPPPVSSGCGGMQGCATSVVTCHCGPAVCVSVPCNNTGACFGMPDPNGAGPCPDPANYGASCNSGAGTIDCTGSCITSIAITSFVANPNSIPVGGNSTLTWSSTGATGATIDQGVGPVPTVGSVVVSPAVTTTYTLSVTNGTSTVTRTVTVTVLIPPTISSFVANPVSVLLGGSSTLSWVSANGTTATIDNGVGPVAVNGSVVVTPAASTTYTLTVTNGVGNVTRTASVTVGVPCGAGIICGTVVSEENATIPIPNDVVELHSPTNNGYLQTAFTDATGKFTFTGLNPASSYLVNVVSGRKDYARPRQILLSPNNPPLNGAFTHALKPATITVTAPTSTFVYISTTAIVSASPPDMNFTTLSITAVVQNPPKPIPVYPNQSYWMACWTPTANGQQYAYQKGVNVQINGGTVLDPLADYPVVCP